MASYTQYILREQGKPTGQGRISIDLGDIDIPQPWPVMGFIFFNYNIGGNLLKPEHKAYVKKYVVPFVKAYPTHLRVVGTTSATGSSKSNKKLSLERILLFREFLEDECRLSAPHLTPTDPSHDAKGESGADQAHPESEMDRAVLLKVASGRLKVPTRPRRRPAPPIPMSSIPWVFPDWKRGGPAPEPPETMPTNWFKVRYKGGVSAGNGVAGGWHAVEIYAPLTGERAVFDIREGHVTASPLPVSVSLESDTEYDLRLSGPRRVKELDGLGAGLAGGGGGRFGLYRFEIVGTSGADDRKENASTFITTGFTFGAGLQGTLVGEMRMQSGTYRPGRGQ